MLKILNSKTLLFGASLLILTAPSSFAQETQNEIDLPATEQSETADMSEKTTHALLRLTPDKSELIRLDDAATSIIVGNPAHVNVIADSAKTLVVIPRKPGATHFTVLGKQGQVIMQRHVIVASPKEDYVRVKRTCSGDDDSCEKTSVFYCPDMCHQINIEEEQAETTVDNSNANSNGRPESAPPSSAPDEGPDQ